MQLLSHFERKVANAKGSPEQTMAAYKSEKNARSIDQLPGLPSVTSGLARKNKLSRLDLGSTLIGVHLGLLAAGVAWYLAQGGWEKVQHWLPK